MTWILVESGVVLICSIYAEVVCCFFSKFYAELDIYGPDHMSSKLNINQQLSYESIFDSKSYISCKWQQKVWTTISFFDNVNHRYFDCNL